MKFVLSVNSFSSHIVVGTPYSIIEESHPYFNHKDNSFNIHYNFWLTDCNYGHMMYMFGCDDSFYEFWEDADPEYLDSWINIYKKEIEKLESENEN